MSAQPEILDRLREALTQQLNVRIVHSLDADTRKDGDPENTVPRKWPLAILTESVTEPVQVFVGHEVEVAAHGIVLDEVLGTLALLTICDGNAASDDRRREIEQSIHSAIHVRQVLRQSARRPAYEPSSYGVELVLVVEQRAAADGPGNVLAEIAETLRGIMARSGFLHAIGVSVLHVDPDYDGGDGKYAVDPGELRRAFPWLLTDVRKWLRDRQAVESETRADAFDLQSIELLDFRVAGSRRWDPYRKANHGTRSTTSERQRLHLIHGANGAGKSSFTEAIELVLTDQVARLERSEIAPGKRPKYVDVLTNRQRRAESGGTVAATVTLKVADTSSQHAEAELICQPGDAAWQSKVGVKDDPKQAMKFWERLRGTRHKPKFQSAGAFRLDQVFSDRIVGASAAERAELFLDAFFPDGGERLETQKRLGKDFEKAWEDLPLATRPELRVDGQNPSPEQAIGKLTDLVTGSTPASEFVRWSGLEGDLATLVPESLPALKAHWPAHVDRKLKGKLSESRRDNLLTQLDDSYAATERDARSLQSAIETALPLLRSLDQWEARSGEVDGTIEEFAECLNDWLEKHADWDLAEKSRQLVETRLLLEADGGGRSADGLSHVADEFDSETGESLQPRLTVLAESAQRLDSQRDEAHRRVLDFRLADDSDETSSTDRPHLSTSALEALDRVATTRDSDSFSVIVQRAVQSRAPEEFLVNLSDSNLISGQIGRPGGLKRFIASVERQLSDVQTLLASLETRKSPFAQVPLKLKRLRETAEACQTEGGELISELKQCLEGPLQHALNELLALMTPARWAYRDVISDSDFEHRSNELDFVLPAVEARRSNGKPGSDGTNSSETASVGFSLLLNTAELNSFALALFLLCAPKLDNPLRLLVLDDPFQNMDELTVSTIGRAIGRLMRLWQNEGGGLELWNLLLLVHGEGTMNRIRNEVACSAAYLPWLQPKELDAQTDGAKSNGGTMFSQVEMDESLLSRELDHPARQGLIEIVQQTSTASS